jgi:type II secretory ATPase GspE/PulE/Tfp pilus assembly ATPase PilB-like protein
MNQTMDSTQNSKHGETQEIQKTTTLFSVKELLSRPGPLSIIELVQTCIEEAYDRHASDVHIEPTEHEVRIRFRIDGILHDIVSIPRNILFEIIARIKVLSNLRTDEHQAAQDGRFRIQHPSNNATIDVRVSIVPTYYGENAVLRLLADHSSQDTLALLGFNDIDKTKIEKAITQPYGMILATGPTGSGKTTTLYTLIKMLNTSEVSIITIEDPVEYAIQGITQIQINQRSNLTFSAGLRSILRQDPNIIMVGEIRDAETAGIAVNTALTGHLLLSTLHTNDAATTLPRMLDMGIDAYLVASTVHLSIGQRLVRKACLTCRTQYTLSNAEIENMERIVPTRFIQNMRHSRTFYTCPGCDECKQTGYNGRIGMYEVLSISSDIREAILRRESATVIKDIAVAEGMTTMLEDGINKAREGETTLSEVLRTINE